MTAAEDNREQQTRSSRQDRKNATRTRVLEHRNNSSAVPMSRKRGRPNVSDVVLADSIRAASSDSFLSAAFRQHPTTVAALNRHGNESIYQFRRKEELPGEGHELGKQPARGDAILASHGREVLKIVASFAASDRSADQVRARSKTPALYGFGDTPFHAHGEYENARVLINVTADLWFDPYAQGYWEAARDSRANLRVDLRGAMQLIWDWGLSEHRALGYALAVARTHPQPEAVRDGMLYAPYMPFEPFTRLYERTLGLHLHETPYELAGFLSAFTLGRLEKGASRPGATAKAHLYSPAVVELRERFDLDLAAIDANEHMPGIQDLDRITLGLYADVLHGRVTEGEAVNALDKIRRGLPRGGKSDDA